MGFVIGFLLWSAPAILLAGALALVAAQAIRKPVIDPYVGLLFMLGLSSVIALGAIPAADRISAIDKWQKLSGAQSPALWPSVNDGIVEIAGADWAAIIAIVIGSLAALGACAAFVAASFGGQVARNLGYESWGHATFSALASVFGVPLLVIVVYLVLVYFGLGPVKR